MSPMKIIHIALVTVAALAVVTRIPMLRRLVLARARTPGPVTAGEEAPLTITTPEVEALQAAF